MTEESTVPTGAEEKGFLTAHKNVTGSCDSERNCS